MEMENSTDQTQTALLKRESVNKVKHDGHGDGGKYSGAKRRKEETSTSTVVLSMIRLDKAYASRLTARDVVLIAKNHPLPSLLIVSLLFFMGVEYTLKMVPSSSPPFDVGFLVTEYLHAVVAARPTLNSVLAACNTVFVGSQMAYIFWTLLVEGRPRSTIAALFMFTCRGILGYSTQLPLPQGFLGSGVDFPVGNVSFFLFFSGHVGGSMIASLDMRRKKRYNMAWTFDVLNVFQSLRLLATRGHYTVDLAAGLGAGFLFDALAGKYEEIKRCRGSEQGYCCSHKRC
ncbi:phosphatidylcholine:diacylglycerol cholinephosphotransferase 1-like [Asparagus officinalis]|nr:phosphatidylcholine:diacylglycerol cholinephosphotransferase 1-like [Asparagus officinalis]XP_020261625.1 phosphatidylcholine:diacylglycerol cholinephosphotransferase 1-like [Asparagus officinalis]